MIKTLRRKLARFQIPATGKIFWINDISSGKNALLILHIKRECYF